MVIKRLNAILTIARFLYSLINADTHIEKINRKIVTNALETKDIPKQKTKQVKQRTLLNLGKKNY